MDEMLGIASHMSTGAEYDRNRAFEIERSVAAGVSLLRRGFYWPSIEPEDDAFVFEGYDTMVALLRAAGLAPCALLTRAARWAAPGGSPNEIDPSDFADFCARIASRYADDIDLYEIWNEENSELFWSGGPDPDRYGSLLRAAFEAIHRSDPSAQVIFGGMSPLGANLLDPRGVWNFLARVGQAHPDLCEFLDGVAIHPYSFLQQAPPEFSLDLGFYRYPDLRGSISEARHILEGLGCPDTPIHLTEIGWPSLIIGLERQAAYLARGALLARAAGAASYFWYTFYDEAPVSSIPTEDYFGLYSLPNATRDPDPKPSYEALMGLHKVLGDARYGGDLASALGWGKDAYALVFCADRARTVALWRAGSSFSEEDQRVRAALLFLLVLTFGVLVAGGQMIDRAKPPVPKEVRSFSGELLFTGEDILRGQNLYFSRGGQHIGTIWGHGSYLAPDWSADFLHRMGLFVAARYHGLAPQEAAGFSQKDFEALDSPTRARLSSLVQEEIKTNRYEPQSGVLTLTPYQAEALEASSRYYTRLFRDGDDRMGLQPGIVRSDEEGAVFARFFAWLAWAAGTRRPGAEYTYTSNWPYDPLVGNTPLPDTVIWSIVSVILLILGIAAALILYLRYVEKEAYEPKLSIAFKEPNPTPSQKVTLLYFLTAIALFVCQIGLGAVTAHFTVEGTHFFGIPLAKALPYAATRTWHLQLAVFFIATCFLAAGLFIGPFVGREPKGQAVLVAVLFAAVVVVVVGALSGTWLSVSGVFGEKGFYLGHQGYEYIELGRVWQLLLIAGMMIWLVLVVRAILPALRKEEDSGGLTHMLLYSAVSIPLFYMAGLMYTKGSHISNAEYWRWWVVHLWVEGFFEVFATVVMAFLLTRIGALSGRFALTVIYFTIFLYLGSGVIGTFHHLYWTGTPTPLIALGALFSALEVVPLALIGFEVVRNMNVIRAGGKGYAYKWPILFFVSVSFWNLVGAGIFGFLINPPIVLYYSQGMNTTPIHSHTALFGVYGLLAISLMLFSVRHIVKRAAWSDRMLAWSFWGLNGGLAAMAVLSLIPSGFYQLYYAIRYGVWFARSPEITSGPVIRTLSWMRLVPDLVFAAGAIVLLGFLVRAIWLSFFQKGPRPERRPA